jgi:WD40 repeat protein
MIIEDPGKAQVFDVASGAAVSPRFGQDQNLWRGGFSPDGTLAVTASEDGTACVWRISDGTRLLQLAHPDAVLSATFSPDGLHIATSCVDNFARIWNARSGKIERVLRGHTGGLIFATYSRDGRFLVTTGRDNTARIWNTLDGKQIGKPYVHPSWVGYADLSADNSQLLTACFDHTARAWDVQAESRIRPDLRHGDGVNSICFSPDGRIILTACLDHTARLWLASTHEPLRPYPILRHSDRVTHAVFSPDGHRIATTCVDGTVRIWDLAGSRALPPPIEHPLCEDGNRFVAVSNDCVQAFDAVSRRRVGSAIKTGSRVDQVKLSPTGRFLLTVFNNAPAPASPSVQAWSIETGQAIGPSFLLTNSPSELLLSTDGGRLVAVDNDAIATWNLSSGTVLARMPGPGGIINGAALSPDGRAVAAWNTNGFVRVWDAATGQERFPTVHLKLPISNAAFSPDNSRLVLCTSDKGFSKCWAQVRDATTGKALGTQLNHDDGVLFASFDELGKRVATAGEDFAAFVWDAGTGHRLTPPMKHGDQVYTARFSPDRSSLVTASADRTARVWSASTGQPLTPPFRHPMLVLDARFSRDGRHIITTDKTGAARVWDLEVDSRSAAELLAFGRLLMGDMVSPSEGVPLTNAEPLITLWHRLRTTYPGDFTVSSNEVAAWYRSNAEESERQQQWASAVFHLERLEALDALDKTLPRRLAYARQQLSPSNAPSLRR